MVFLTCRPPTAVLVGTEPLGLTLDGTGGDCIGFVVGFWLPVLGSDKV